MLYLTPGSGDAWVWVSSFLSTAMEMGNRPTLKAHFLKDTKRGRKRLEDGNTFQAAPWESLFKQVTSQGEAPYPITNWLVERQICFYGLSRHLWGARSKYGENLLRSHSSYTQYKEKNLMQRLL